MYKPKEHVPNVVKLFGVYLGLAPDLDQRTTATQHFVSFFMFLCENGFWAATAVARAMADSRRCAHRHRHGSARKRPSPSRSSADFFFIKKGGVFVVALIFHSLTFTHTHIHTHIHTHALSHTLSISQTNSLSLSIPLSLSLTLSISLTLSLSLSQYPSH